MLAEGEQTFDMTVDELHDALFSRQWRTINWAVQHASDLAVTLGIEIVEEKDEDEEAAEKVDQFAAMK